MEKISEKTVKGRPRLLKGDLLGIVAFAANPGVTERSKQSKFYQLRAVRTLGLKVEADTPKALQGFVPPRPTGRPPKPKTEKPARRSSRKKAEAKQ